MTKSYRNTDPRPPIMKGIPVPARWRVPPLDWDQPPWNRWAFQHMRELVTTVDVPRGDTVWDMLTQVQDVDGVGFTGLSGAPTTWGAFLNESFTDASLIWLDGKIIHESYFNGMAPRTPHLGFSMSKSIVSTVTGMLIDDGLMDPAAPVTDLIPELSATAWTGATLQHVLDMTSGVVFDETYGDPNAHVYLLDVAANLKPLHPDMDPSRIPATTWDLIMSLTEAEADHGARFSYRSIETDLLGYLIERASGHRLADLVSDRLWGPMGAEQDGFFTVDRAGFPLADGGFNASLRDFARFGRLLLDDGARDGRQIIPRPWIDDIRSGPHGLFDDDLRSFLPAGCYRNKFWVEDAARESHLCLGIHGQHIWVDRSSALVAVKLSSWPTALSEEGYLEDWMTGVRAVTTAFGG